MKRRPIDQETYYRGVPTAPYDLVKEIALALGVLLVVVLVLSAVLSSPDVPPVTIQTWTKSAPLDFLQTATAELQGTTISADYGPPYNLDADGLDPSDTGASVQTWGPLAPQLWAGVHQPINAPETDVIAPLRLAGVGRPGLSAALASYQAAGPSQEQAWLTAYQKALTKASVTGPSVRVPAGAYGPVNVMMQALLADGRAGALDSLLLHSGRFYVTDYTKPLLFLADGGYFPGLAEAQKLTGSQWGMMNETGRYPGQAWLWLFTLWYQIPPYNSAQNADLLVVLTMGLLTTLLLLVPFIPGLRDLPRWLGLHRLVWREHYRLERQYRRPGGEGGGSASR
ncbi:MAG: hypothetical protein ACYCS9_03115 [Candidatus Dormibacteria bacterium]